jgi:uncharacterized FAD-dependent dehydrogenase
MSREKEVNLHYDVLIIGAGPAGLSAGYSLSKSGKSVLIVDKGLPLDDRTDTNQQDVSAGIGGAGLYSDGKLSFYPSATKLWKVKPEERLKQAYKNVGDLLSANEVEMATWKSDIEDKNNSKQLDINSNRKWYKSIYIDMKTRKKLINTMLETIGFENVLTETEVLNVTKKDDLYAVSLSKSPSCFLAEKIVYAAGRYGATDFTKIISFIEETHFIRYEIGVRVETESSHFKPYNDEQTDYKYIENVSDSLEIRSFCCCRDGKVVQSRFKNIVSFNGSGDISNSTRSNIGINLRIKDPQSDPSLTKEAEKIINGSKKDFVVPLVDFMTGNNVHLGAEFDLLLRESIKNVLGSNYDQRSLVYGPTIEGVGHYPVLEKNRLKIANENIWLPGDCSGMFRGLLAAFISGSYVALDILSEQEHDLYRKLNIKVSPTDEMRTVFTAQSKAFFYCRDAICEFVLKQEMLPINPFRVFDYFLNDRVDRDVIRRGNNQLIKRCDELWVFGPISDGVLFEIARAKELKMPIKFFNVSTTSDGIYSLKIDDVVFESEVHAKQVKRSDLIKFLEGKLAAVDNKGYEQLKFSLGELK